MKQTKEQFLKECEELIKQRAKWYNMSEEEVGEKMWELHQEAIPCYEVKK